MISEAYITGVISNIIGQGGLFLVGVTVRPGNKILVLIDSMKGVAVGDCAMLSRAIEQQLDRDTEDFELEVSSPGLTQPFKVIQQYQKAIGRQVEVLRKDGDKHYGMLVSAENNSFVIETKEKAKSPGKKKAEVVTEQIKLMFDDVKSTKVVINL
jgi:ribosome maturation factor RimP